MPYQCTYELCSDPNRLYASHQEWFNHESLHTRVWHCQVHESEFETESKYTRHLQQEHPEAKPESFSSELVAAAVGPSSKPHRECPLCPELFSYKPIGHMHQHMRYHLEHLALFTLPADPGEDGGGDWDASGRPSDSHEAIQGGGRRNSVDRDFPYESRTASTKSMDPSVSEPSAEPPTGTDPTAFDDIRRHSQQRLVDPAALINSWLTNQPGFLPYPSPPSPDADGGPPPFLRRGELPPIWLGWAPQWDNEEQAFLCM